MRTRITKSDGTVLYLVNGKPVSEQEYYRLPKQKKGQGLIGWKKPLVSDALAVHPNLIDEAVAGAKKHGVPTEFNSEGQPLFTSEAHKRKYLKAYGYLDKTQIKRHRKLNRDGNRRPVTYFVPR